MALACTSCTSVMHKLVVINAVQTMQGGALDSSNADLIERLETELLAHTAALAGSTSPQGNTSHSRQASPGRKQVTDAWLGNCAPASSV